MRKGEILTLTWDAIDLDQGIIFLNETKNGYPRSVAVAKVAKVEILKLREQSNPLDRSVFPSKNRFGKIDIRKAWYKVLKQAGIENFVFRACCELVSAFMSAICFNLKRMAVLDLPNISLG